MLDNAFPDDHDVQMASGRRFGLLLATVAAALAAAAGSPAQNVASPIAAPTAHVSIVALPTANATPSCRRDYYKNVDRRCVHRPVTSSAAPSGATAQCTDASYSFSLHASGTCSHHGGVARWIHHP
jgi:hypothetical protein